MHPSEICSVLFLFIRSDITTTLIPVSVFALITCPNPWEPLHAAQSIIWLLLHLLQFNFSNQLVSIEEDKNNKPYRPLPSHRISVKSVWYLCLCSRVVCLIVSSHFGGMVFCCSTAFVLLTILCNEANGAKSGITKNLLNAGGISMFLLGTLLVLSQNRHHLDIYALNAIALNFAVIATTIHAQDFRDIQGDTKAGRHTLPISMPLFSRYTMLVTLPLWAWVFTMNWDFGPVIKGVFLTFSLYVGIRYTLLKSIDEDNLSYRWYNFVSVYPGFITILLDECYVPA
ncbi:UbiA prenyltransferase family [Lentinula novae-zelandiae]|nr:UbiA prenyltransferase family [Lentinula novae-zelandiae]